MYFLKESRFFMSVFSYSNSLATFLFEDFYPNFLTLKGITLFWEMALLLKNSLFLSAIAIVFFWPEFRDCSSKLIF